MLFFYGDGAPCKCVLLGRREWEEEKRKENLEYEQAGMPYSKSRCTKAPYNGMEANFGRTRKERLIMKISPRPYSQLQYTEQRERIHILPEPLDY